MMKNTRLRLRLFFYPYLIVAISFILLYTFLNWLLVIETGIINVKEDLVHLWLPAALPFIPMLIWINPRLKLLHLDRVNSRFSSLYFFLATGAIVVTTIITQNYLSVATGKISSLESIHQLDSVPITKYYTLKRYFIDKSKASYYSTATVSGKHNDKLNYRINIVVPVYEKGEDTLSGDCPNWLGIVYKKQISNNLSDSEKDDKWNAFATESEINFEATDLHQFTYLERMGNTDERDELNVAVKKSTLIKREAPQIFIANHDKFENRTGNKLEWIFISFGIGTFGWLVLILLPKLNESALSSRYSENAPKENELKEALSMLVPKPGYYVTPLIINLNLVVFLIMVFAGLGFISFKAMDLVHWGANFRPLTINGEWWRLMTSIFLHSGVMHIIVNLVSLMFVGVFLEPVLGTKRFAVFYLLCGIAASCTSLWWHSNTVSVGASGAIFGLYGIFLALMLLKVFPREFSKAFLVSTLIFIGYNLLMGLTAGIDNAAHIGGLLSGFLVGLLAAKNLKAKEFAEI
jgi:membrane associated rhomboid family serine protease